MPKKTRLYVEANLVVEGHFNMADLDEKEWLIEEVLLKEDLIVHSNDVGDTVGFLSIMNATILPEEPEEKE